MFDVQAFGESALAFLVAFVAAGVFTVVFKIVYQALTPYDEAKLIREGNVAAAIALGGAVVGYVLPLASALSHTVSLMEFAAWALLAGVIQIAAFTLVRFTVLKDLIERIEKNELAAGVYLASISLAVGLLNAACMTS
jgi:putative membrane protein